MEIDPAYAVKVLDADDSFAQKFGFDKVEDVQVDFGPMMSDLENIGEMQGMSFDEMSFDLSDMNNVDVYLGDFGGSDFGGSDFGGSDFGGGGFGGGDFGGGGGF